MNDFDIWGAVLCMWGKPWINQGMAEAIIDQDCVRFLALVDEAEEAGAPAELCEPTRKALREWYGY